MEEYDWVWVVLTIVTVAYSIKATLCRTVGILRDLAPPTVSYCKTTVVNKNVRRNVGANYEQNSWHHILCLKLACWAKHVCDAVILPSHWRYITQKQVIERAELLGRRHHSPYKVTVPRTWIRSCYYNHCVALIQYVDQMLNNLKGSLISRLTTPVLFPYILHRKLIIL